MKIEILDKEVPKISRENQFDEVAEILKNSLGLREYNLTVYNYEDNRIEVDELLEKYENIYMEEYQINLRKEFKGSEGIYLSLKGENTVIVKKKNNFANLAHELRHVWQHKNNIEKNFRFKRPVKSKKIPFIDDIIYCISKTEYDANNYARKFVKKNKTVVKSKKPLLNLCVHYLIKFALVLILVLLCMLLSKFRPFKLI